jgi:hypothetical protein
VPRLFGGPGHARHAEGQYRHVDRFGIVSDHQDAHGLSPFQSSMGFRSEKFHPPMPGTIAAFETKRRSR